MTLEAQLESGGM